VVPLWAYGDWNHLTEFTCKPGPVLARADQFLYAKNGPIGMVSFSWLNLILPDQILYLKLVQADQIDFSVKGIINVCWVL